MVEHSIFRVVEVDDGAGELVVSNLLTGVPCSMVRMWESVALGYSQVPFVTDILSNAHLVLSLLWGKVSGEKR